MKEEVSVRSEERWHIRQKKVRDCERKKKDILKEEQREQGRELGHKEQKKNCSNLPDKDGKRKRKIEKDKERNLHSR